MKLIVGLGNPGSGYAHNRHNIGFMCLSYFARRQGIRLDRKQRLAKIGLGEIAGDKVVLARPQTYMNLSGESVSRLVRKFKVSLEDLIVIHDDLDLPLGKVRIRYGSSSGGHRGINSIITHLDSKDFCRVRVGIGHPVTAGGYGEGKEDSVIAYVLSDFDPDERQTTNRVIPQVSEAILCLLSEGLTASMNRYN